MSKRWKAAVIGGSGYGGAELIRRLLLHPEVELVRVTMEPHGGSEQPSQSKRYLWARLSRT